MIVAYGYCFVVPNTLYTMLYYVILRILYQAAYKSFDGKESVAFVCPATIKVEYPDDGSSLYEISYFVLGLVMNS